MEEKLSQKVETRLVLLDSSPDGFADHRRSSPFPKTIQLKHTIKMFVCGEQHVLLLTSLGNVLSMGNNLCGQLGIGGNLPQNNQSASLIELNLPFCVSQIACGLHHNAILSGNSCLRPLTSCFSS